MLAATLGAAPADPPSDVVLTSALGSVPAATIREELARRARDRPDLAPPSDPAGVRAFLEEWLFTEALAAEVLRLGLDRTADGAEALTAARRHALRSLTEERLDAAAPPPTEARIDAFLAENAALVHMGERLRLRHIFKRVAADAAPAERERARAQVGEWRRQVAAGADLAALARVHSDSETAKFDGAMTPLARGQVPAAIERAVWALAPGEVSEVVETRVGFHLFRLEQRLAPETLGEKDQRAWARLRLQHEARAGGREQRRLELLAACNGREDFGRLDDPRAPDQVVFRMGAIELRRSDLERERAALPFAERHTRSLAEMARAESWTRLLECGAQRDGLERDPSAADALAAAERRARAELAYAGRLESWRQGVSQAELRKHHRAQPARFAAPARLRVRILVLHAEGPAALARAHDRLLAVARDVREGRRDLAQAATGMSDDASAARGGDLGFVLPRDLAAWIGQTALDRILRLADGEVGGPMQVEVYRADRLASVPEGFLLARVEGREPERARTFEESRDAVADAYQRDQAVTAREAIRRAMLAELRAEFHPERLIAP